jgi:hypothetical protein
MPSHVENFAGPRLCCRPSFQEIGPVPQPGQATIIIQMHREAPGRAAQIARLTPLWFCAATSMQLVIAPARTGFTHHFTPC